MARAGRGRIALWTLTDSYRLVLAGRDDLYGELWSDAIATLARAQARNELRTAMAKRARTSASRCAASPTAPA